MRATPTVVYTAGVFDLLHRGHFNFLWRTKALGDILVVGVVTDSGCEEYKGVRPAIHEQARKKAIERIPWIDVVEYQSGTDPSDNLRRFRPDIMTHADDWDRLREGHETLEELGIEWVLLPYTDGVSSTQLREQRRTR